MTPPEPQSSDVAARKIAVRKSALAARAAIGEAERAAAGDAIAAFGGEIVALEKPACVALFFPVKGEIDVLPLAGKLARAGVRLCLPVIVGKGEPLLFRDWRPDDPLEDKPFGLKEPFSDAADATPDLLFVPLAAFDRAGGRIGYGGGFYDRTLAKLRSAGPALAVGVAFSAQETQAVPVADHDERIDFVLTEAGVVGR